MTGINEKSTMQETPADNGVHLSVQELTELATGLERAVTTLDRVSSIFTRLQYTNTVARNQAANALQLLSSWYAGWFFQQLTAV